MSAKRTDANQPVIVAGLRGVGAWVFDTHVVGHGFPDLVVVFRRYVSLLEVKMPGAKLTADEMDWHLRHPGAASIVYSLDDALRAIGAMAARGAKEGT